jgi:hypothetical protein
MTSLEREYCPTCKHIISRDRVNLSSLEFRRLIHNITDLDELISNKDYLYRFIRSTYRVKEYADNFLEILEDKLDNEELDTIKLWILSYINNEDCAFPPKEIGLYKFLCLDDADIFMTFSEFYDSYSHWIEDPMSKNRVSRALLAFGIKTTMKKIVLDGKTKNTIMICISKEELLDLYRKNGFNLEIP